MFTLPTEFDQNEWFVLIWLIISYTVAVLLPKKFPLSVTILIMLYGSTVGRVCDHFLAGPEIDLYKIMDTKNYDLFDLFTYFLYAPFSYFFIYIYEWFEINGGKTLYYLIVSSTAGAGFEWLSKEFGVFTYNDWKLIYSLTVYLFVQCLTLLLYNRIKREYGFIVK